MPDYNPETDLHLHPIIERFITSHYRDALCEEIRGLAHKSKRLRRLTPMDKPAPDTKPVLALEFTRNTDRHLPSKARTVRTLVRCELEELEQRLARRSIAEVVLVLAAYGRYLGDIDP